MRTDILTITLNPTVDYSTTAPRVFPDHKLRCTKPTIDPGGGGINVARAIRLLDGQATSLIAIGGPTGARLLELLALEGVPTVAFQGPGETRQSTSVIDVSTGQQYRFVMPGPSWTDMDVERGLRSIDRAAGDGTLVVLSGSQPPGVAKDFPSILAAHVAGREARLIVDTSGPALQHLVEEPRQAIYALRMDAEEAESLAGRPLPDRKDTADFARSIVDKGVARTVIVARGADGSVLASRTGRWHSVSPPVKVLSRVGAGDSFVGAFTLSIAQGEPPEQALAHGTAAATSAVMSEGTSLCQPQPTSELLPQCAAKPI